MWFYGKKQREAEKRLESNLKDLQQDLQKLKDANDNLIQENNHLSKLNEELGSSNIRIGASKKDCSYIMFRVSDDLTVDTETVVSKNLPKKLVEYEYLDTSSQTDEEANHVAMVAVARDIINQILLSYEGELIDDMQDDIDVASTSDGDKNEK